MISKVLVNRLKSHLPHIVSENQNAFIPGRLISDIAVAHERDKLTPIYLLRLIVQKHMIALNGDFYRKQYGVWDLEKSGFGGSWLAYLLSPI